MYYVPIPSIDILNELEQLIITRIRLQLARILFKKHEYDKITGISCASLKQSCHVASSPGLPTKTWATVMYWLIKGESTVLINAMISLFPTSSYILSSHLLLWLDGDTDIFIRTAYPGVTLAVKISHQELIIQRKRWLWRRMWIQCRFSKRIKGFQCWLQCLLFLVYMFSYQQELSLPVQLCCVLFLPRNRGFLYSGIYR